MGMTRKRNHLNATDPVETGFIRRTAGKVLPVAELARIQVRCLATSATGEKRPAARLKGLKWAATRGVAFLYIAVDAV
jgi:hypothetical protein